MNTRTACFLCCGGLLLAAWVITTPLSLAADAPAAAVQKGDSMADVKRKLGDPRSDLEAGNRHILIYPQGQIVLENGRVTEFPSVLAATNTPSATSTQSTPETAHPPDVTIIERQDGEGVVTIIAQSDTNTDFTITFTANLTNMTPSHPLPYTADSNGQKSFVLLQLQRDDPTKAWKYSTYFDFHRGGRGGQKITTNVYLLPYQSSETHRVLQGNFGKFSHSYGSQNEYAVDFECPTGTLICAARAGVVTGVRQDFTQGGTDEKLRPQANYIIIRHDDGTYAEYVHLQHNGALVKLGQHIDAGQHIARAGATGFASGPHIHFAVFQTIDGKTRMTLPIKFQTANGVVETLTDGESY